MRRRERKLLVVVRMLLMLRVLLWMDCRIPIDAASRREMVGEVGDVSLGHLRENSMHHLLNCLLGR